jgi:hypothetical protein
MSNHVKAFFSGIVLAFGITAGTTNAVIVEYVNSVEELGNKFGQKFFINRQACNLLIWDEKENSYQTHEMVVDAQSKDWRVKESQYFALLFVVPNGEIEQNHITGCSGAFAIRFNSIGAAQQGLNSFLEYINTLKYLPGPESVKENRYEWSFEQDFDLF